MKPGGKGLFYLELQDAIRVNQLVRGRIDFDAFKEWYISLSTPEQSALSVALYEFACQAEFDEKTYNEALSEAKLSPNAPLALYAKSFHKPHFTDLKGLHNWTTQLNDSDRFTVFRMLVYLFGKAEGTLYERESKQHCNHWWHRDLLDERVIQALLSDPYFYRTSMKDDDQIKESKEET